MRRVRLGAVGYLNARPHIYGLERSPRFEVRFDLPSRCAELLHEGEIDVGLIPSIEYLRGSAGTAQAGGHEAHSKHEGPYRIVPGVAIASRGRVESVALYTTRSLADVRSIALDTSSRTSVALVSVLCAREFRIHPTLEPGGPDLESMLVRSDAALLIGDKALFLDPEQLTVNPRRSSIEKIDLGEVWTRTTGLPFVYAFWAGRSDALTPDDIRALQEARNGGVAHAEELAQQYFSDSLRQAIAAKYLRDNIKYDLGPEEQAGLELFYRYAVEAGAATAVKPLRFYF